MVVGLEIQYGRQNVILFVLSCHGSKICQKDSPHQNVLKLTLSQKSFFVFRKDRQCKFKFLLSPNLDLINIISVRALKALDFWTTLPGVLYKTCVKPKEESTLVIPSWNILTEENLTQFENLLAYSLEFYFAKVFFGFNQ